jgi:hypothetical protein
VELPKPPWYRRFGVLFLAANLLVAAVLVGAVVALWPPAAPRPGQPATTVAVASQPDQVGPKDAGPTTIPPSSTTARREPGVLWQGQGRDAAVGEPFQAPGRWRIRWSFDCENFAAYGGATSSCPVPVAVPSARWRCSALGSGDAAACRWPVRVGAG